MAGATRHALMQGLRELKFLVVPDRCLVCRTYLKPGFDADPLDTCFCPGCKGVLPLFRSPFCPCCGHLFDNPDQADHLCESCLKQQPRIGKVRAAFAYDGIIRTAISLYKYDRRLKLAAPLASHLYDAFDRHFSGKGIDLILPIPLHPSKAVERKFNQAVLLARRFPSLSRHRRDASPSWRISFATLIRRRATESQTGLDQRAREKNLKGAFSVRTSVKGRQILLLDDVYTSGATCRSAAGVLLDAGARGVDVLVLARA